MTLLQARAFMETSLLLGSVKNCCPSNWVHFQSSCYFFSTNTMSWASSLKNCSDMGAHLVVINTREEQVVGVQPPPMSMRPSSQHLSLSPYVHTVLGHSYYLLNECIEMHAISTISVSRYLPYFHHEKRLKRRDFYVLFLDQEDGGEGWEFILEWPLH